MVSDEDWESNGFFFLRTLSFTRIVFYGIALVAQMVVMIGCLITTGYCDVFTVLVPPLMIFIDVLMMRNGRELQKWFYGVYLIVTMLSIGVGFRALFTILFTGFLFPSVFLISPSTIAEHIMRVLSYGVIAVSFIQMMLLIYLTRPSTMKQEVDEEDLWLLDQTTDIQ